MAKKYIDSMEERARERPPATTPEGREQQLAAQAMDASERRIKSDRASSQELIYHMRAGSPNAKLERKILELQAELLVAKTEALQSQKRVVELYADALAAMRAYSGSPNDQGGNDYED